MSWFLIKEQITFQQKCLSHNDTILHVNEHNQNDSSYVVQIGKLYNINNRLLSLSVYSIDPLNERTEGVHTRVLELGSIGDFGGVC